MTRTAINAIPRLSVRLVHHRALAQTSETDDPEVISLEAMLSIEVPLMNARRSEPISNRSEVETAGKLLERAWDACVTKVERTAKKRPSYDKMRRD